MTCTQATPDIRNGTIIITQLVIKHDAIYLRCFVFFFWGVFSRKARATMCSTKIKKKSARKSSTRFLLISKMKKRTQNETLERHACY